MVGDAFRTIAGLFAPTAGSTPERPAQRMRSWVLLCAQPIDLHADDVRRALDHVFPEHFLPECGDGSFVTGGPTPEPLLIKSLVPAASGLFMLTAVSGLYTDASRAFAREPQLAELIRSHRAWMAIDCIQGFDDSDPYGFISPALAHLAPADAVALLQPTGPFAMPFNGAVRQQLAAGIFPDSVEISR